MGDTVYDIKLLQASVDPLDESHFRILVDGKFVKYLTIDAELYSADDMCFEPSLISILPPLPPGDWNTGRISRNCADGRPHFSEVTKVELPCISHLWHPLQIDHLDLHMGRKLRSNVYEASTPQFDLPIVVKFARFPWEIPYLDSETSAYQWIQNHQIGPQFLGHLTEEGRVIGFVMERITSFRHATPEDLALCQQALSKLHRLSIKHGDINKHNFLIHDNRATLIDFDSALRCNNAKMLEEEFRGLEKELSDMSGRGGRVVESSSGYV
ncbi:alpha-galactosidase A precursor [Amanita rubescens]|nr:alpha-galactosidase A precursor [Amanita rubescens]